MAGQVERTALQLQGILVFSSSLLYLPDKFSFLGLAKPQSAKITHLMTPLFFTVGL